MNENEKSSLGSNPIKSFFSRKTTKIRVGRPKTKKEQSGNVKNLGNSTSEATLKSKSSKANTAVKSNIIPVNGAKKNEEENEERMKWSTEYLHKVKEFWDENISLEIDLNGDPITYLKSYAVIIVMPHPTLYKYFPTPVPIN